MQYIQTGIHRDRIRAVRVCSESNAMTTEISRWKTVLLKSIGVGFALTVAAIVGIVIWHNGRPKPEKPWNQAAIKATPTGLVYTVKSDRLAGDFRYSLQNTTDKDYRLPSDSRLMVRLAQDMSYRDAPNMTWEQNLFIPAGQKVNVSVMLPIMYSDFNFSKQKADDEKQLSPFVDRRLSEIDGFVLFDSTNRYKVDFPNGWPEAVVRNKKREESKSPTGDVK